MEKNGQDRPRPLRSDMAWISLGLGLLGIPSASILIGGCLGLVAAVCTVVYLVETRGRRPGTAPMMAAMAGLVCGLISIGLALAAGARIYQKIAPVLADLEARDDAWDLMVAEYGDLSAEEGSAQAYSSWVAGRKMDAERALRVLVYNYPEDQSLLFLRGSLRRSRRMVTSAHEMLQHVAEIDPASLEGRAARAVIQADNNPRSEADLAALEALVAAHPEDVRLLVLLESVRFTRGDYKDVLNDLRQLEARITLSANLQSDWGHILERQGEHEAALEHRRASVELEPRGWAYQFLGENLAALGRFDEADDAFAVAVEKEPRRARFWRSWGEAMHSANDVDGAIEKFTTAMDLDPEDTDIPFKLHFVYRDAERYEEARVLLEPLAEQGHLQSMVALGYLYEKGLGVKVDHIKALVWYRKAADGGNGWGMTNLAWMFKNGRGVQRDFAKAGDLFKQAYEAGHRQGAYGLGLLYAGGKLGWDRKLENAVTWFQAGARSGDTDCMRELGRHYRMGWGIETDLAQARRWLSLPVRNGDEFAMVEMGELDEQEGKMEAALTWYRQSAEAGCVRGMICLARCFREGNGVGRDWKQAVTWYRRAAELDDVTAMNELTWVLSTCPDSSMLDGAEAVRWGLKVAENTPGALDYVDALAAAYARNGQFAEAVETQRRAIKSLSIMNEKVRAARIKGFEERLKLYVEGRAYTRPVFE